MTDFEKFQKIFKKYQKLFGLTGYKIYFKYEPLDKSFAEIRIDQYAMVATVSLNNKISNKDKPFKKVERHAKHEAIHLLLGRLEDRAKLRYVSADEIYEAVEELVVKLEGLICV